MPTTGKRCFKCNALKPVASFYRNRSRSDGYADNCRECQAVYRKLAEARSPGVTKAYNRAYYGANRARLLALRRNYRCRESAPSNY